MSIFFKGSEEDCIDPVAFMERDWITDRVIKEMLRHFKSTNSGPKFILIGKKELSELKEHMGSKYSNVFYGPGGPARIIEVNEPGISILAVE